MKRKLQTIKRFAIAFTLMVGALTLMTALPIAEAGSLINPSDNPQAVADATGGESSGRGLVKTILNYFLGFLGFLAVIMIIYGGVTYTASAGNDDAVNNAKNIIKNAVIGLIVVLLSFVIVNTVLGAGTGVEP